METAVARITSKYQVVLPRAVREALELQVGEDVIFLIDGDTVLLRRRPASFTAALRGLHQEVWTGKDMEAWLHQERGPWEQRS
jgi:AbrB family looped-hinge helix DNA binding protein